MRNYKTMALLTAVLLAFCVCACALAEDAEYEDGNPPLAPELMLRSDYDAGMEWTYTFLNGGVAELATDYMSMETLREADSRGVYEGEGGYTWARIDGIAAGTDTLTLTYGDEDAPLSRLSIAFRVDDALNVIVLAAATDDAELPEVPVDKPVHPVLLLKSNPAAEAWTPDNSFTPGLSIESEYVPAEDGGTDVDMEIVTLSGTGEDSAVSSFNYARSHGMGKAFLTFGVDVISYENTDVNVLSLRVAW